MFLSNFKDNIDSDILKLSKKHTFNKRESFDYLKDYAQILDDIVYHLSNEFIESE